MSAHQLDALFASSQSGPIPDGEGRGTAIIAPGTVVSKAIADAANLFFWKGKVFNRGAGTLLNRITPFGVTAIAAKVYVAPSWFDGKDCIVLDYSKTSIVAKTIRDEIRLIAPNRYLGLVFWMKARLPLRFSLDFAANM
jgi:hypothetical protein